MTKGEKGMKYLILILMLGMNGCAAIGIDDYDVDPDAIEKTQRRVDRWLAQDQQNQSSTRKTCRSYEWTNIYGQKEIRTDCQ